MFLMPRFLRTPEVVKEELIPQDPKGPRSAGRGEQLRVACSAVGCGVGRRGGEERAAPAWSAGEALLGRSGCSPEGTCKLAPEDLGGG